RALRAPPGGNRWRLRGEAWCWPKDGWIRSVGFSSPIRCRIRVARAPCPDRQCGTAATPEQAESMIAALREATLKRPEWRAAAARCPLERGLRSTAEEWARRGEYGRLAAARCARVARIGTREHCAARQGS